MTKENVAQEAKTVVYWHNLYWWVSRGVKCPDCSEDKLLTIECQDRKTQSRVNSKMLDEVFRGHFVCGCGCKFYATAVVKDALPRKHAWSGGDLWD
jgi:hypothetical protein